MISRTEPQRLFLPSLPDLPVSEILSPLLDALATDHNIVVVAPPGAGKTTLVPLALLDAPWRGDARVIVVEPRRVAARAAAHRMAELMGEKTGALIGYRTRTDSAISDATRIECVTEGLLVRRLLSEPTLDGVAAIIFDEVHERSLDLDLALALALDLQRNLRPELRIIAMSATPDGGMLASLLDGPILESQGRMYPVDIRPAVRDIAHQRDLPDAVARCVRHALAVDQGDILAFLPGVGEINRTRAALQGCGADVLVLHGELAAAEQDNVLCPPLDGAPRRVILATSIAETSLTVPGVRIVVDGGLRRAPRLDPSTGLSRLETMRISRATATQRAGRAGREGPGITYRLWTDAAGRAMAMHDRPEIAEGELSGFWLDLAAWQEIMGTAPDELSLADTPPKGATEAARSLLRSLGALDDDDRLTKAGMRIAQLGAHPRLGAMMLAARNPAECALAADIAALVEERDPIRPRANGGTRPSVPPADIALRLDLIAGGSHPDADRATLARIRQASAQYRRRLRTNAPAAGNAAALLAAAFPDRVAQRRGEPGSFRLSGGGGARLGRDDALASSALLAVAHMHVRTAAEIRMAAALDPDDLPQSLMARTTESVETTLDPVSGAVMARRRLRLGALVLRDRTVTVSAEESSSLLRQQILSDPRAIMTWSPAARQFAARLALARKELGREDLPDLESAASTQWEAILSPWVQGLSHMRDVRALDMLQILRSALDHATLVWLDRALPTHLDLPGGRASIDYEAQVPTVSARAQYFYGLTRTPQIADGRASLQFALLSPAGRPQAITGDLASFWKGGWSDMRRDMRGRYPRHDWPENPETASPQANIGKSRMSTK